MRNVCKLACLASAGKCWSRSFVWSIASKQRENVRSTFSEDSRKNKERKVMMMNITAARVYWREAVRFESSIMTTHAES